MMHDLTLLNRISDMNIISLYIWGSGGDCKGDNWIAADLRPDSSVSFTLPSGKCNILAFDESGNSYGIAGNYQKNAPDTIAIDLEHITFGRPNVDYGQYLLNLTNSLSGFALDTLILTSASLEESIVIDDFRVFPGSSVIIWLSEGIYSINAVDQTGRRYSAGDITVPDDSCVVSIVRGMLIDPLQPIGITGNGSVSLLIENCLLAAVITELQITPLNASDGIYLENITIHPGESMVANLYPGIYSVTAKDDSGAQYYLFFEQQSDGIVRLSITHEYLKYDFSFPVIGQEQ